MTKIETLARVYLDKLSTEDKKYLAELAIRNDLDFLEHRVWLIEVPRDIRNSLQLWSIALDDQHPDEVSSKIAELVKAELIKNDL